VFWRQWLIPSKQNNYEARLISKPALAFYTVFLLLFNLAAPALFPESQVSASSITSANIVRLTNNERQNLGLKTLRTNSALNAAAYEKAYDMIQKDYWAHFGPNGETPWQFIKGAGFKPYRYAGENLAKGFTSSEGVHQAWMASPTHRDNIVNSNYADIGVAVVHGKLQGDEVVLVVQMFGTLSGDTYADTNSPVNSKNVKSNVVSDKNENGDIKSISISFPEDDQIVTTPKFDVEGQVDASPNVAETLHVVITEGNSQLDLVQVESDDTWVSERTTEWAEGPHELSAKVAEQEEVEEVIEFVVDTQGPDIFDSMVDVSKSSNEIIIEYEPDEENVKTIVAVGNDVYVMDEEGEKMVAVVSNVEEMGSVKIVATDENGNSSEHVVDVNIKTEKTPILAGLLNFDSSPRDWVNIGFSLTIMLILIIQIYHYAKLKLLEHKGGHLFTIGIWFMLILVATVVKSIGFIT
jgi:uncharacterized protein YkwD